MPEDYNMTAKAELMLMLFYSNYNQESLATKIAIAETIHQNFLKYHIQFKEVDCDVDIALKQQYRITGIPTLLAFIDDKLIGRFLGEITKSDIHAIMHNILSI